MALYEKCPPEVSEVVSSMMEKFHGPLHEYGVTVDLLFAMPKTNENGDAEDCALKLHGYQCAAIVKINPYKARVQGHADAEIIIDKEHWEETSEAEHEALIDHELEHLELKLKDGELVRDDLDRPKLRMRKHDHQFGWFDSVARRHGKASLEVQQFEAFRDEHGQLWLNFNEGPASDISSISISAGDKTVTTTPAAMKAVAKRIGRSTRKAAAGK